MQTTRKVLSCRQLARYECNARNFFNSTRPWKINKCTRNLVYPMATKLFPTICSNDLIARQYSTPVSDIASVDEVTFERVCEETLESLTEYFEEIVESSADLKDADVSYSSGVLTINFGSHGIYVINRQSPNKQIWLSSPVSGPKRYDLIANKNCWLYKHTGETLHQLLQTEISKICDEPVDFSTCAHSQL